MDENITGSCLCGSVRYEIAPPFRMFQYCHCSRCRKATGAAHSANLFVPPAQFSWLSGAQNVGRFEHPQAKHFATGFCKTCGSPLPWLAKSGRSVVVPAGTLDADPEMKPQQNIFWQSRAPWLVETSQLEKVAELPTK